MDSNRRRRRRLSAAGRRVARGFWWSIGVAALVVTAGVTWSVVSARIAARGVPRIGERVAEEWTEHVPFGAPLDYRAYPPTSGPHYPAPAKAGVYSQGLSPGFWVHNLEHGYVVLVYRPPVSPDLIREFEAMVRNFPRTKYGTVKLIVVPYEEMLHPFAVLAWNWRLSMDQFDRQNVLEFYRAHVGHGPEDVS